VKKHLRHLPGHSAACKPLGILKTNNEWGSETKTLEPEIGVSGTLMAMPYNVKTNHLR
jgi:hypothetical protein